MLPVFEFLKDILLFSGYLSGPRAFPKPLCAQEESAAIAGLAAGDEKAREKLIEHNLRLVAHIAKKYSAPGTDADDLISIGAIGLIKGVNTFKPERGRPLAAYAARCIENEILMYMRSLKKSAADISLSEPIGEDAEGNRISLADIISTGPGDVVSEVELREDITRLGAVLGRVLSKREQVVIELRYGLSGRAPLPQRVIAERLGISRSYVSRIEKRALEKLARAMEQ